MLLGTGTQSYYLGMEKSKEDKMKILDYLVGNTVLEIGFGDGFLLEEMENLGMDCTGVDPSDESMKRGIERDLKVIQMSADEVVQSDIGKFDNIVLSSVCHEIFSYNRKNFYDKSDRKGIEAYREYDKEAKWRFLIFLRKLPHLLNDNGRIIIRDGLPSFDSSSVTFLVNEEDKEMLKMAKDKYFLNYSEKNNFVTMRYDDAHKFLYSSGWGLEAYKREVYEDRGALCESLWDISIKAIMRMKVIKKEIYTLPGYKERWESKLVSKNFPAPPSTIILVLEKVNI